MSNKQRGLTSQWKGRGSPSVLIPILFIILLAIIPLLLTTSRKRSMIPAAGGVSKIQPAKVEALGETGVNRVVLTEKAAERLGIETALVREEQVVRKRTVGGKVVTAPRTVPRSQRGVWVEVRLNESDLNKVDLSQPARILPLARDTVAAGLTAKTVQVRHDEEETVVLYYVVENAEHNLVPGQRARVELPLLGSGTQRKIVPFSAVLYDLRGETWVYTNPAPLTFVRNRIRVDYIAGELAVLLEGPPVGTKVVTVGVALLSGVEFGVGK